MKNEIKRAYTKGQSRRFAPPGFTTLEILLVVAIIGLMNGIVWISLSRLQPGNALNDAEILVVDTLRRVQLQADVGHFGDQWGVHLSDSDGCLLPARKIHIFRGPVFTSATDTIDTIDLPDGATVTALAIGGGCDAIYRRYEGSTASTGTVTLSNAAGETRTVTIHTYGLITSP